MNLYTALKKDCPWMALIPAICSFAGSVSASDPSTIVLADQGRPAISILISENASPTTRLGAEELQRYLGVLSGAQFPESDKIDGPFLLVCPIGTSPAGVALPPAAQRLQPDGYCIAAENGNLFLVGENPRGTLYAVYDFLERLGCRWLAPGFSFYEGVHEVTPKSDRLVMTLPDAVVQQPMFKYRKLYVEEGKSHNLENLLQMVEWMPKRRFNTLVVPLNYAGSGRVMWDNWRQELTPELQRRGIVIEVGGHGYENFLNAEREGGKLFDKHPEWFGQDEKGNRRKSRRMVFCTSTPAARDFFIRNVVRYLDAHPEIEIFDFWPPDGAKWCQCPDCKALGLPSDRQAILLSQVATLVHRRQPKLKFETIAYHDCGSPPKNASLDKEVLIDFCPIRQCFESQIYDSESSVNMEYVSQLRAWLASFKGDVSIYSYYRKYAWKSLPMILPHYIKKDLQFYQAVGVHGISSYAEPGDWGTYELNHYALGALAWNPDTDVNKLIHEFCTARFGAQADLAQKAYQILEDNVRHVCRVPGTGVKTVEEYKQAEKLFYALAQELDTAVQANPNKASAAALRRLRLGLDYATRDLSLRQGTAQGNATASQDEATQALGRFLRAHAGEGVFVTERIPIANQAPR